MRPDPAQQYREYIRKAKNAKTDEEYQEFLNIAIYYLEKISDISELNVDKSTDNSL